MSGQHGGTPGALELRAATGRSLRLFAAIALLLSFGWWMGQFPGRGEAKLIQWGSVLLGLAAVPAFVRELLRRGPVLVLSHAGLEDRRTSHGLIPWSAIAGAELVQVEREKYVMLRMRDTAAWQAKPSLVARWMKPLNEALGFRGVPIDVSGLSMPADQVAAEIRRRLQARVER
jgi:hypothetical protein